MQDELRQIGFYTLSDERAKHCSETSPLWRCELIVTSRCNFSCPYCRGTRPLGDATWEEAARTMGLWAQHGLKHVRFSGGEPTLWPHLGLLVKLTKDLGVTRIGISTNGSADLELYWKLISLGVDDIAISLDGCCADTINQMAGGIPVAERIIKNIREISRLCYTTVGIVVTDWNRPETLRTIQLAKDLGVSDIRIIPAAQSAPTLENVPGLHGGGTSYPILHYRVAHAYHGLKVRGLDPEGDSRRCFLTLDDMVVWNGEHYPCVVYMREGGAPIGKVGPCMRDERALWHSTHDCFADPICSKNCLDFCTQYNRKARDYKCGGN